MRQRERLHPPDCIEKPAMRLLERGVQPRIAEDRVLARAAFHAGELFDQQSAVLRRLHRVEHRALALGGDLVYRQRVVDERKDERQHGEREAGQDQHGKGLGVVAPHRPLWLSRSPLNAAYALPYRLLALEAELDATQLAEVRSR